MSAEKLKESESIPSTFPLSSSLLALAQLHDARHISEFLQTLAGITHTIKEEIKESATVGGRVLGDDGVLRDDVRTEEGQVRDIAMSIFYKAGRLLSLRDFRLTEQTLSYPQAREKYESMMPRHLCVPGTLLARIDAFVQAALAKQMLEQEAEQRAASETVSSMAIAEAKESDAVVLALLPPVAVLNTHRLSFESADAASAAASAPR